jgi:hypothetical protein
MLLVFATNSSVSFAQVIETTPQAPKTSVAPSAGRHAIGIGGRIGGSSMGLGVTARGWRSDQLGVEFQLSRYDLGFASVTQFAPVVLFRFARPDTSNDVKVHPYVGAGWNVFRVGITDFGNARSSSTSTGLQVMGGAEVLFEDYPRLSLSADLGYHSSGDFSGDVKVGGIAMGLALHWYLK